MKNGLSIFFTAFFFIACGGQQHNTMLEEFKKREILFHTLLKTEKIQLYKDGLSKILLVGTYLGDQKASSEYFIIGLYRDDMPTIGFTDTALKLSLNRKKFKKMKKLSRSDKRLKNFPFLSDWMHYYLVEFPYMKDKRLYLELESVHYGKGIAYFSKTAKYTLE